MKFLKFLLTFDNFRTWIAIIFMCELGFRALYAIIWDILSLTKWAADIVLVSAATIIFITIIIAEYLDKRSKDFVS